MRFQKQEHFCGPASLQAALMALGTYLPQEKLADSCGTTEAEGTDEFGVIRGILAEGFLADPWNSSSGKNSLSWLMDTLTVGRPAILCLGKQHWQHWVTALGILGDSVIIFDPARYPYNVVRSGTSVWNKMNLVRRWYAEKNTRRRAGAYYAIGVGKNE